MQYPSWIFISTFDEFPLVTARLTDPRAQNVKKIPFDFWPDVDLTHDLNLKM